MDTSDDTLSTSTLQDTLVDPVLDTTSKRALGRGKREVELSEFGVGSGDTSEFPSGKGTKKSKLMGAFRKMEQESPISSLGMVPTSSLIGKVDPSSAGDHSPSIASVNRVEDKKVGISGRKSFKGGFGRSVEEDRVPTFQFNTDEYYDGPTRLSGKGSAAHTFYTSLREMHGVGERDVHPELDGLLEQTAQAYSPYDRRGNAKVSPVEPPRVNVHAEHKDGPVLHKSHKGVQPLVAQRMVNLWYRNPGMFKGNK